MTLNIFVKNYNFHDSKISNLYYNEKEKEFSFRLEASPYFDEQQKTIEIKFSKVRDVKCSKPLNKIDEYILNIWKVKGQRNMIEIILDDDQDTTIYVTATNVEIL